MFIFLDTCDENGDCNGGMCVDPVGSCGCTLCDNCPRGMTGDLCMGKKF